METKVSLVINETGTTDKLVVERKNAATSRLDVRLVRTGKTGRSTTRANGIINPSGAVIGSSEIATAVRMKKSAIKKAFGITPICS